MKITHIYSAYEHATKIHTHLLCVSIYSCGNKAYKAIILMVLTCRHKGSVYLSFSTW